MVNEEDEKRYIDEQSLLDNMEAQALTLELYKGNELFRAQAELVRDLIKKIKSGEFKTDVGEIHHEAIRECRGAINDCCNDCLDVPKLLNKIDNIDVVPGIEFQDYEESEI